MREYVTPEMEITEFETEDIITTSGYDKGYTEDYENAPVVNNHIWDR